MTERVHLVDVMSALEITSPSPHHVEVQTIAIGLDVRPALFQHPPARVVWRVRLGRHARLVLGCGLRPACWDSHAAPVTFEVAVARWLRGDRVLASVTLDPRCRLADRRWHDLEVDLARWELQSVALVLRTCVPPDAAADFCWAAWSDPVLVHERTVARPVQRARTAPVAILVTAESLRADVLGCAGHPTARTPRLDALAGAGIHLVNARSPTPSTLGGYATMLTGRHPRSHGIIAEVGRLPAGIPTLPAALARAGWTTAALTSEQDLSDPRLGLVRDFGEVVPAAGVPFQLGELTTRRALAWLDRCSDRPAFLWFQSFDVHPPAIKPEPFRSMYYAGDPTHVANTWHSERIALVRGNEALLQIEAAAPLLRAGIPDGGLRYALRHTARDLVHSDGREGDLVHHLHRLGPPATRGLDRAELAAWLASMVDELERGRVPSALLAWLDDLRPLLARIERDSVSWLDGVVDARYLDAQYLGAVSYLDAQLGIVLDACAERGIDPTVCVTAPHGECFGEFGIHPHHHVLVGAALQVPLILKPAGTGFAAGTRHEPFDLTDLGPTLVELLGAGALERADGRSMWPSLRDGVPLVGREHRFALDPVARAVECGGRTLVEVTRDHRLNDDWCWRAGDTVVLERGADGAERRAVGGDPDLARVLAAWVAEGDR